MLSDTNLWVPILRQAPKVKEQWLLFLCSSPIAPSAGSVSMCKVLIPVSMLPAMKKQVLCNYSGPALRLKLWYRQVYKTLHGPSPLELAFEERNPREDICLMVGAH